MGFFSRLKQGVSSKANTALDKAIDPAKELEMAIMELEDGRKKAVAELITYKATAKQMDQELEKYKLKSDEWEKRAMMAVKAGDDEAAKTALREKKNCDSEMKKIALDKAEANGYAVQLNKSRKEFETKMTMLKMRKGTLATQLTAARTANSDVFGNDAGVWDRFKAAEDRIDDEAISSEVDAAMRGEDVASSLETEAKIAALASNPQQLALADGDPLEALKAKIAVEKAAKQKLIAGDAATVVSDKAKGDS
jgi:phage shock protein A